MKRILIASVFALFLLSSSPAPATCQPGYVKIDRENGQVTYQLPRCQPPPR